MYILRRNTQNLKHWEEFQLLQQVIQLIKQWTRQCTSETGAFKARIVSIKMIKQMKDRISTVNIPGVKQYRLEGRDCTNIEKISINLISIIQFFIR